MRGFGPFEGLPDFQVYHPWGCPGADAVHRKRGCPIRDSPPLLPPQASYLVLPWKEQAPQSTYLVLWQRGEQAQSVKPMNKPTTQLKQPAEERADQQRHTLIKCYKWNFLLLLLRVQNNQKESGLRRKKNSSNSSRLNNFFKNLYKPIKWPLPHQVTSSQ